MAKVLLIDDHMELLHIVDEVLEFEGFEVLKAGNATEGIMLAQQHLPDAILCDMMMPDQNGREVRDHLLEREDTARIPLAFITANAQLRPVEGERWLPKPFEIDDVLRLLREMLDE
jgi:CheY-like chemotaxis protein